MNRNIALVLICVFVTAGCWSAGYNAMMMADGNTWQVSAQDYSLCGGAWHSADDCVKNLKPIVERRAIVTCDGEPFRVYNCGHRTAPGGQMGREVACSVQCKKATEIHLTEPVQTSPQATSTKTKDDVIKRAKKCQEKGGVYINDTCQIDIKD